MVLIAGDGSGKPHAVKVNGVSHALGGGLREALVLPAHAEQNVRIEPGAAHLDQVFFARVEEVQGTAGVPLLLRNWERNGGAENQEGTQPDPWVASLAAHETLDLWFDPPHRAQPGRTWTVLIEVECAEIKTRGTPRTESALSSGWLCDVTAQLGLANLHLEGPAEQLSIAPTMGPGLAWGDVDGDGWVDLYLVQGSGRPETGPLPNRLLRNVEGRRFEDITLGSGAEAGSGSEAVPAALQPNEPGHVAWCNVSQGFTPQPAPPTFVLAPSSLARCRRTKSRKKHIDVVSHHVESRGR